MTCAACQRANLPGGVRCIYCGTHFPVAPALDLELPAPFSGDPPPPAARPGAPFRGLPLLLSSMLIYIVATSVIWGWKLAAGLAVCILIHELGHVAVIRAKRLPATAPMFIPFLGALIFLKRLPNDPTTESEVGAGGPIAGLGAALVCLALAVGTHSRFWYALAFLGFVINLFNLLPIGPLDGARIAAVFSAGSWDFVLIALLMVALKLPAGPLWCILIGGFLSRLARIGFERHHLAPPVARIRMAAVYLAICLGLAYGASYAQAHGGWPVRTPGSTQVAYAQSASPGGVTGDEQAAHSDQSTTSPEASRSRLALRRVLELVVAVLWIMALGLSVLGWLLTAYLLAAASAQRFGWQGWSLAGWMIGGFAALYGVAAAFRLPTHGALAIAYFAASGSALVFSIYHAAHARGRQDRLPRAWLTWRCMAWSAFGALIVAYWLNSAWVVVAVLLGTALFYVCRPALLPSFLAHLSEGRGQMERAIALRRQALEWTADPDLSAGLWLAIARCHLALSRGDEAIEALDAATAVPGAAPPAGLSSILALTWRAGAFIAMDRFDEALSECERVVNRPPAEQAAGDRLGPWRLLAAHAVMSHVALYRGWMDEALAQAGCVLQAAPRFAGGLSRSVLAEAYRVRAEAEVAEGRLEEGRAECRRALQWSRAPTVEAGAATIRAQASLKSGDPEAAERETAGAVTRLPGSLAALYWRGRALGAAGRASEGDALLRDLAARFPGEHWGRLAAAALPAVGEELAT
jgi:Zn-dependent protease/tetratricopeptide (TPR) repeat protein